MNNQVQGNKVSQQSWKVMECTGRTVNRNIKSREFENGIKDVETTSNVANDSSKDAK